MHYIIINGFVSFTETGRRRRGEGALCPPPPPQQKKKKNGSRKFVQKVEEEIMKRQKKSGKFTGKERKITCISKSIICSIKLFENNEASERLRNIYFQDSKYKRHRIE